MNINLPILEEYDFQDFGTCSPCGGACCKRRPGNMVPQDLKVQTTEEFKYKVLELLMTGNYVVDTYDWKEGEEWFNLLYLRPRTVGWKRGWMDHHTFLDPCVFLTDNGCKLSHDDRPRYCRTLKPKETATADCTPMDDNTPLKAWFPYKDLIYEVLTLEEY